ncbi:hypothetical protein BLNAU_16740 [Blattamonas nauphoetae]|uniref:Uncharacterized protein n=1 Tax=Blattamonas nauphoetae TaxID=2049346 RepID=A0ABQ9X611_9EUKA|nr:hypothetical protein BLNAU_19098 [Blattamonas nauphoetae]KAK2947195.1 hypothetical protein BLNAU_17900 [Blattamonas nauphoetae]KAK2948291.1 hypothetical protein BLNAU_16740 [Blattamonas nauphoetae]
MIRVSSGCFGFLFRHRGMFGVVRLRVVRSAGNDVSSNVCSPIDDALSLVSFSNPDQSDTLSSPTSPQSPRHDDSSLIRSNESDEHLIFNSITYFRRTRCTLSPDSLSSSPSPSFHSRSRT